MNNAVKFLSADSTSITEKHVMDRYLYRGDFIYSYRVGKFSAGASFNYYFGHDVRSFNQDAGFSPYNTYEELIRSYKGPSLTLGTMANFERFSTAMYVSPQIKLKGSSKRVSLHTSEPEEDYEYELPWELGLGTSILPFKEHKVNVDLHYEAWKQIDDKLEDGLKLGVGWAYEPVAETRDSYLQKLPLRAGFSWRSLPFKAKGEPIDEYAVSCGISFPLKRDINRLDFGFQLLKRGNLDTNKLSDTSFMFMLGFTGFDIIGKASDRTAPRDIPVKEEIDQW